MRPIWLLVVALPAKHWYIYILTCISGHVWHYIYEMYHYSETISKQSYGHNDISLVIQYKAK